jgi:autotransporter-associated beta strand protein
LNYPLITVAGSVTKTGAGTLIFDRANTYDGPTSVQAGTLELVEAAAAAGSSVSVAAGARLTVAGGVEARVAGLALDAAAQVELGTGGLVIAGGVVPADLRAAIIAGRNGGAWNGTAGIGSSDAAGSSSSRGIGYVLGGDGSATVAFAAPGDTNLDGRVDNFDLVAIDSARKFATGQVADWAEGDFNYDGVVNSFDLVAIDAARVFGQGSYLPVASGTASIAAVPEPGTCGLAIMAACLGLTSLAARRAVRSSRA